MVAGSRPLGNRGKGRGQSDTAPQSRGSVQGGGGPVQSPTRPMRPSSSIVLCLLAAASIFLGGCGRSVAPTPAPAPEPPAFVPGTSIVVCGEKIDVGTPVVLWTDPVGFDAYSTHCRFSNADLPADLASRPNATPYRYGVRTPEGVGPAGLRRLRDHGWGLSELREQVQQFVLHYDAVGSSERCFRALHDNRGLSVHFMLDLDGVIYQTLDLRERAFHAKDANDRSIGIEIADVGGMSTPKLLQEWYGPDDGGLVRNLFPEKARLGSRLIRGYVARPARPELISGTIHRSKLCQYDFTKAQYTALFRLAAALSRTFPKIRLEAPRDASGKVRTTMMPEPLRSQFQGIVGHYHLDEQKYDPGPAFDWEIFLAGAKRLKK